MNDQVQSDLDKNIANAFSLVEETYKFCTHFFEDVKAAVREIGDGVEPLQDSFTTTRPRNLEPKFMFTRAFGTFFGDADSGYGHGQLSEDLQIPFILFRLVGDESDQSVLIYGHYTSFQEEEQPWKERRISWFRRPIRYMENVFSGSPATVDKPNLRYQIHFNKDPLSRWIGENRNEQQDKVDDLAESLIKQFNSDESRRSL